MNQISMVPFFWVRGEFVDSCLICQAAVIFLGCFGKSAGNDGKGQGSAFRPAADITA